MSTKQTIKGGFLRQRSERGWYKYPSYLSIPAPQPVNYSSEVTYGPNVPNWKSQIANGLQAGTDLIGTDRKPGKITGNAQWTWICHSPATFGYGDPTYGRETASRPFMPFTTSFSLNTTDAYDQCVIGFLEKVGAVSQKFSSGTFAGELRETLSMLRSPFRGLQRHLGSYLSLAEQRAFRRIRIPGSPSQVRRRRIAHRNRVVSETWLEYSFGLLPLLHDINDATAALVSLSEVKPTWERVNFTVVKKKELYRYLIQPPFSSNVFGTSFEILEEENLVCKLYGAVSTDRTTQGKFDAFGLNIRDVAPTIWELIPYSFLIDYAANVGGLINALCVRQSQVRWKMRTIVQEVTARGLGRRRVYPLRYTGFPYSYRASDTSSVTEAKLRSVSRQTWDILLAPQLVFRIPTSGTKWLNMAALFRQSRGLESRLRI